MTGVTLGVSLTGTDLAVGVRVPPRVISTFTASRNIALAWVGQVIGKSGAFGMLLHGFCERLLIPTGLHPILNETVRFTPSAAWPRRVIRR